jgi:CPA2 family monovalent cation:H+ antiporter-2
MDHLPLILTLTGGLAAALLLGYITQRLGLSPIVGYLLAGIVVGPKTPGFTANRSIAEQLAEIGVILLMFGVGLQFHLKELLAVRRVALPGAIGQSLVATLLGLLVTQVAVPNWTWQAGVVFGLAISVASTVVLLRVLSDNNDLHTPAGHIAVGWLVVEDLLTVLVLVLLPVLARGEEAEGSAAVAIGWSLVKIGLLVAFVFYVGGRAIPWLLARIAATRSRELFTLTVLVVALGIAVGAAQLFGVSMALGAFLAGMVVGQSDFSSRAGADALPMRDAFAVLFFVSVGMLLDPAPLWTMPLLVAATLAVILIGKPLAALAIVLVLGHPLRTALAVAVALAQIGEFSFILAALALKLEIMPKDGYDVLVVAAILSISLNPVLYRLIDVFERRAKSWPRLARLLAGRTKALPEHFGEETDAGLSQAVVVGYGPVGRTLVRLLQENEVVPTVIELNLDTVRRLRDDGVRAVYGDSIHKQTLAQAGVEKAAVLFLTSSSLHASDEVIRLARELNPKIRVIARANYLREVPLLKKAGADAVFAGEGEVALTMTEHLLRQLGASGEQIDRERDRIRSELFGAPLTVELLLPTPNPEEKSTESSADAARASSDGGD